MPSMPDMPDMPDMPSMASMHGFTFEYGVFVTANLDLEWPGVIDLHLMVGWCTLKRIGTRLKFLCAWLPRLKLIYDKLPSRFAYKFNLRPYIMGPTRIPPSCESVIQLAGHVKLSVAYLEVDVSATGKYNCGDGASPAYEVDAVVGELMIGTGEDVGFILRNVVVRVEAESGTTVGVGPDNCCPPHHPTHSGPDRYCSPHHSTHFGPSFIELNGIL